MLRMEQEENSGECYKLLLIRMEAEVIRASHAFLYLSIDLPCC